MSIGDVNSKERGTGARFNSGKPDMSLVPLKDLGAFYARLRPDSVEAAALIHLGAFQETHDPAHLYAVLDELGEDGWEECARVFEYGKHKYAAWNWAKGMPWSVPLACGARHLLQIIRGEQSDAESRHPHRGHVFCNVAMLLQFVKTYIEGNDLPPKGMLQ